MQDVAGTAQGNWWNDTDPTHDALFGEEHAIALANWNVTPTVQLFSLNENVPGFSHALLEASASPDDVNSTFEFPVRAGPQRTNRRFAEITDGAIYCYDLVRIHHGGPRLEAVILLQVSDGPGGPRSKLTIEFVRASRCPALPTPWRFNKATEDAAYFPAMEKAVTDLVCKAGIDFLSMTRVVERATDPLALYAKAGSARGHFNAEGYRLTAGAVRARLAGQTQSDCPAR